MLFHFTMASSSKIVPSSIRVVSNIKSASTQTLGGSSRISTPTASGAVVSPQPASPKKYSPLPSKHRLIAARSSSTSLLGGPAVPSASAVPHPDGDVYIVNVSNASGALSVCYSPDLRTLAVGESNGEVRILKTGSHDPVGELVPSKSARARVRLDVPQVADGSSAVTCLRAWPAEAASLVASYANGSVRVWDLRRTASVAEVQEERQCLGLAVSPNRNRFVTLGDDGGVYLYDVSTLKLISKLSHSGFHNVVDGHKNRTFSAVFHPQNADELISGGWDNTLHFWDTRTRESVRRAGTAHVCGTEALDITRNGTEVMACSWRESDQLQLWDYSTARLIDTIHPDKTTSYLYAGRYLSESLLCCGGSDTHLFRLVHIGQKATVGTVSGMSNGVYSIALGPVGARIQQIPMLNNGRHIISHNKDRVPRIAFCSNKKVVELEVL